MLVRVQFSGDGSKANPWVAPFPTYVLSGIDEFTGLGIISIPDDDAPAVSPESDPASFKPLAIGHVLHNITPQQRANWHARLDTKYGQSPKRWRPEVSP